MTRPIGLLTFEDRDGDPLYVEASQLQGITKMSGAIDPDIRSCVRLKDGSFSYSREPPVAIAARYDSLVRS